MNRNIEEILKNLGGKDIPPDVKKIAEETAENFSRTLTPSRQHILWRIIMKSPITKLAVAAVIIVAAMIGINHFGGSIDGTTPIWANTLERIYEATSVTCKKTFEGDKAEPFYFEEMVNENGVIRAEIGGTIIIEAYAKEKTLQLDPSKKEAMLTHRVGQKRYAKPYNKLDWLVSIKDDAGDCLGTEDIDGTLANKFFWQRGEYNNITVWVDPSTELPIKVKEVFLPNPDKNIIPPNFELNLSDFGGADEPVLILGGIQKKMIMIMKDFVWNQQLDPALFSTEPPEGYTLWEYQHDVSDLGEIGLIQALAFWTEMSGGSFPEKINDLVDPNLINPMLIEKFDRDGDPWDEIDEATKQAYIIRGGLSFAQAKKTEQNWHYAGKGVYLGDSDAIICWWKAEDSNDYCVIYGDLSVGDTNEMPELQESE